MTVLDLKPGEKAVISGISTENVPLKLFQMGCIPGTEVIFVRTAPLKDPIFLNIGGANIAILREIAQYIEVQRI